MLDCIAGNSSVVMNGINIKNVKNVENNNNKQQGDKDGDIAVVVNSSCKQSGVAPKDIDSDDGHTGGACDGVLVE